MLAIDPSSIGLDDRASLGASMTDAAPVDLSPTLPSLPLVESRPIDVAVLSPPEVMAPSIPSDAPSAQVVVDDEPPPLSAAKLASIAAITRSHPPRPQPRNSFKRSAVSPSFLSATPPSHSRTLHPNAAGPLDLHLASPDRDGLTKVQTAPASRTTAGRSESGDSASSATPLVGLGAVSSPPRPRHRKSTAAEAESDEEYGEQDAQAEDDADDDEMDDGGDGGGEGLDDDGDEEFHIEHTRRAPSKKQSSKPRQYAPPEQTGEPGAAVDVVVDGASPPRRTSMGTLILPHASSRADDVSDGDDAASVTSVHARMDKLCTVSADKSGMYHCPMKGCARKFTRNSNLRRHWRIHEAVKRFKCETCGKKFMEKVRHERSGDRMHGARSCHEARC